ncbi:N-formylglutamate amidohydrolase [Olivibacter ginsenosidimutans]|uniref:N-formylglutamate amidohydrolase n=1 Tax=Olivibacter ginsenosidimutans TaxID=1176537 RepID=A0ABP9BFX5_9SPHI
MESRIQINKQTSPIIATALHDGHYIPSAFHPYLLLEDHERMREEDPYTAYIADLPINSVVAGHSRFLTDLNRPKDKCIYKTPDDAWGLQVWKEPLPTALEKRLLAYYDLFYRKFELLLKETIAIHGAFVVLDIHSYNYKRKGVQQEASSARKNPEINIGTAHNAPHWQDLIHRFTDFLAHTTIHGHTPDVRENIKFKGGEFSNWIYQHYGHYGCTLSIEFKKTFMDEWTGRVDIKHLHDIHDALNSSIPLLSAELAKYKPTTL